MAQEKQTSAALAVGGIAAIVASACCLLPLLLVSIGVGGAWMSQLQVLQPYRPLSLAVAIVALALAWWRIYRPAKNCAPEAVCAVPKTRWTYKIGFWVVAALVLIGLGYPYVVPYFY